MSEILVKLLKETFLRELDEIGPDDFIEPDWEISPGETIVGEMNDLEKAIATLFYRKSKLKSLIHQRLIFDKPTPTEKEELEYTFFESVGQKDTFYELMWAIIRERLNLYDKAVGLRRDSRWFGMRKRGAF